MVFDEESEEFVGVLFLSFFKRKFIWLSVKSISVLKVYFLSGWKIELLDSEIFNFSFDDDDVLLEIVLKVCKVVVCKKIMFLKYFRFMVNKDI